MSASRTFHCVLLTAALCGLNAARALAGPVGSDFLLVSSVGTNSILEYNTAGVLKKTVVTASNIDAPFQMAFAPGDPNTLYFPSLGTSRIFAFDRTTSTLTPFVSNVNFNGAPAYPGYIQFDTDPTDGNTYLYVNDFKHNQILRYWGPTPPAGHNPGDPAPSFGQTGAVYVPSGLSNGVLNSPTGLTWGTVNGTHTLLAINSNSATNDQIMQFTENSSNVVSGAGNFVDPTSRNNSLVNGAAMHILGNNLWVSSFGNNQIIEYNLANGTIINTYTNTSLVLGANASLNEPSGFAFDSSGNLFIANAGANDIVELDPVSNSLSVVVTPDSGVSTGHLIPIDVQFIAGPTPFDVGTPEPSSVLLLGIGLPGAAYCLRRRT